MSQLPSRLPDLPAQTLVAVDTEGSGLFPDDGARISAVSVAWMRPDGSTSRHAFPFGQGPEDDGALFSLSEDVGTVEWGYLCDWLRRYTLVMQNGQYDVAMFWAGAKNGGAGVDLLPNFQFDTMLAEQELNPKESKSLDAMSWRRFRHRKAEFTPPGTKTDPRYDLALWEDIREYAEVDAELTIRNAVAQIKELRDHGIRGLHDRRLRVVHSAIRMERIGLPYAAADSVGACPELARKRAHHGRMLPFAPPTDAQAKAYFFGGGTTARGVARLGLEPLERSENTGKPSLNDLTIRTFVEEGHEGAYDWWAHQTLKRVESMYYRGWAEKCGADGRLRARIKTLGTVSGRWSIERINLQAMPHEQKLDAKLLEDIPTPRKYIEHGIAALGLRGWEFDLQQAELRVGALLADCTLMLDAFRNGDDLHQVTADQLECDRQTAKMSNFLLLFGGGAETFRTQVKKKAWMDISPQSAARTVRDWRATYREFCGTKGDGGMVGYWDEYAARNGWVPFHNGLARWWRYREDTRKAWNQRVQGSIAQFMIDLVPAVEDEARKLDCDLVMTVHDSMIILGEPHKEDELAARITELGARMWAEQFPGVGGGLDMKRFEAKR